MIVLSIGGSLISPTDHTGKTIGTIDFAFVKTIRAMILRLVKKGQRFIIVTGGGGPCRAYVNATTALIGSRANQEDLHWIGIAATKLNAEFFRVLFKPFTHPVLAGDPSVKLPIKHPILLAAGYRPGHSTDMDAVILAHTYGASAVINLTNIDYVYSADPKKDTTAKPFSTLSWNEYKKVLGMKTFRAASHVPFDPVAAAFAQRHRLSVRILNGTGNLSNVGRALQGKSFIGTTLHP